eukprot:4811274-Pyramimonas_sp.AAC.1
MSPVWAIASSGVVGSIKNILAKMHADWALFKIEPFAKYLGVYMGPGAGKRAQWSGPAAKRLH